MHEAESALEESALDNRKKRQQVKSLIKPIVNKTKRENECKRSI